MFILCPLRSYTDKIYIFAGYDGNNRVNDFWQYDTEHEARPQSCEELIEAVKTWNNVFFKSDSKHAGLVRRTTSSTSVTKGGVDMSITSHDSYRQATLQ